MRSYASALGIPFLQLQCHIHIVKLISSGNFEESLVLCKLLSPEDSSLRSAKEKCPAGMTREDEEIPYIRVDCEGAWDTFNSRLEDQIFNFDVHVRISGFWSINCDGHKRVVEYNELDQSIGESATKLKSFIGTTVRVHVPISYQSWKDVSTELKDKIYELIEMVSNKGHEWRKNNKYNHRMLQKGYANLAEEMKARTTKDGEIPDTDTKEVANKINNLLISKRATHSIDNVTYDILSQVIGGNDPLGRIRGVGQYVTSSKYFHIAREKRKKVNKEEDYAKE
uniref:Uncharacterized protein n=1 Tax=Cucumis melo TaxID=3656 RepID=A0A9I9EEJ8_CUCME